MPVIAALFAGTLFGIGLTVSDMVNPARVLNFLDFAGTWDPTLILVMIAGLAVAMLGHRLALRRPAPLFAGNFNLPTLTQIDAQLVGGSALFGVGWGLAGICPGPALADIVTLSPAVVLFVIAMLAGMLAGKAWRGRVPVIRNALGIR